MQGRILLYENEEYEAATTEFAAMIMGGFDGGFFPAAITDEEHGTVRFQGYA